MYEVKGEFAYDKPDGKFKNLHLDAAVNYAYAVNGTVRDSDYLNKNESSRSYAKAEGSDAKGVKLAIGYNYYLNDEKVKLTPIIGYSFQKLKYAAKKSYFVIPYLTNINDRKCTYMHSKWHGPFIGGEIETQIISKHSVKLRAEYHLAKYESKLYWKLRKDLSQPLNGRQKDNVRGVDVTLTYNYHFKPNIILSLSGNYLSFKASKGKTYQYKADGTAGAFSLNKVNWNSKSLMAGITYKF